MRFSFSIFLIFCIFINCETTSKKTGFRIVSLSPAMTEIVFALGSAGNLVGVTTYCNYPDSAKNIYKVGDFSNPSIERIINLNPDLVIVNLPEQNRIKQQLDKLGIKTFATSPKTINDIYQEIVDLGRILKREKQADSLVNYMKMHIKFRRPSKKRVYIELCAKPLITIGADSYLNELIEMAGGKNIFSDLKKDYPVINQEQVIIRNPEIIIVLHPEGIMDRMSWQSISAIKNKKVYLNLNQDWLMRPGPRLVLGFKELEKILE
ncbi:MAG: ABC transporter substrate-binding protein [bacterium]